MLNFLRRLFPRVPAPPQPTQLDLIEALISEAEEEAFCAKITFIEADSEVTRLAVLLKDLYEARERFLREPA